MLSTGNLAKYFWRKIARGANPIPTAFVTMNYRGTIIEENLEGIIQSISSSKKTLYILCGLPYSGKTYLALKIIEKVSCVYISIDHILKDFGYDWDSNNLPNEQGWKKVFDISYQKSQEALKNGLNVLYDSTNHTRISRDILRKVAYDVGANAKVIYVTTSVEIVWKRWEENSIKKDRSIVDKKLIEMTIKSFEAPTEDENLFIVQSN